MTSESPVLPFSPSASRVSAPAGPVKVVEARGMAYEIGLAFGQELAEEIHQHLALMAPVFSPEDADWKKRRSRLLQTWSAQAPQALAELRGMADGASAPFDELLWLHTECADGQKPGEERSSNLVLSAGPDGPLWAKRSDRPAEAPARPLCVKVVHRTGQHPVVVLTLAGLLATGDGMNAAGLCIGKSTVGGPFEQSDDHLPIHIWAYEGLFACSETDAFIRHMTQRPLRGQGHALVCVDRAGAAASLEAPCPLMQIRRAQHPAGHLHCANLYQLPALTQVNPARSQGQDLAREQSRWMDEQLSTDQNLDGQSVRLLLKRDPEVAASEGDLWIAEYSVIASPARREVRFFHGESGEPMGEPLKLLPSGSQAANGRMAGSTSERIAEESLRQAMQLACGWIQDVAQLSCDTLPEDTDNRMGFAYTQWRGAVRGEYRAATRRWDFFCPAWHTGQAVKALTSAVRVLGDPTFLRGARAGADFLLRHQIWDTADPDHGLLLAFEDEPEEVNTSAVLESMDGLLLLADHDQDEVLRQRVVAMGDFLLRRMYMPGMGLFRDLYHPGKRQLGSPTRFRSRNSIGGRPLLDDGLLLKLHRITGRADFLQTHLEIAHRLVADQYPRGNWLDYGPCDRRTGVFHPRHTYWWGLPLIDTFLETGDLRFLETAIAAGEFTRQAMRADGGYIRGTFLGFRTDSFGHATSGSACAAILFMRLLEVTGDSGWLAPAEQALGFCLKMQLSRTEDPNLRGAILEKVLPPDGTDRLPYHLRDLGTIFFVTAAATYLRWLKQFEGTGL